MTTPNTTGPSAEARELAESLFTNGSGDKAERLVLWQDTTQRDLGGWCRLAVADQIDAALSRAREDAHREALEEAARDVCAWCGSRNMLNGKPSPALIGPNAAGNYTHKSERGEVLCAASAIYSRIRFEDSNHA